MVFLPVSSTANTRGRDGLTNIRLWDLEFCTNPAKLLAGWNIFTQRWLKKLVYEPLVSEGWSRSIAVFATFLVSAFWHGFYPGYYCNPHFIFLP